VVILAMEMVVRKIPDALPVLSLLAAVLAWVAPSRAVADRVDVLLAALVLATALDIDPGQLIAVLARWRQVLMLALVPLPVLALGAWALAQTVHGATRTGVIALGLSPTEVASVGLIGLMAGPAEVAIAVLACSLVVSAIAGPPLLSLLAGGHSAHALPLLGRFALVVILPLVAGLLARGARPELGRRGNALSALSSLLVVALIYASLSGTNGAGLGTAIAVSAAFLALSALLAAASLRGPRHGAERTLALTIGMRDFAVAAALASAAAGSGAARVAGVYGVLMLFVGASITGFVRSRGLNET
jgi:predicted Na+-dependent transporter